MTRGELCELLGAVCVVSGVSLAVGVAAGLLTLGALLIAAGWAQR